MKQITSVLAAFAFVAMISASATAQNSANQNVTIQVSAISKLAVSGDPGALIITAGAAGTDALTPVSDASTDYSITHNSNSSLKITAGIDAALSNGYKLEIALVSAKGTTAGTVDISNATTAVDVVTAIAKGADANKGITYTFSADASAGELASTTKVVTLTLTN